MPPRAEEMGRACRKAAQVLRDGRAVSDEDRGKLALLLDAAADLLGLVATNRARVWRAIRAGARKGGGR